MVYPKRERDRNPRILIPVHLQRKRRKLTVRNHKKIYEYLSEEVYKYLRDITGVITDFELNNENDGGMGGRLSKLSYSDRPAMKKMDSMENVEYPGESQEVDINVQEEKKGDETEVAIRKRKCDFSCPDKKKINGDGLSSNNDIAETLSPLIKLDRPLTPIVIYERPPTPKVINREVVTVELSSDEENEDQGHITMDKEEPQEIIVCSSTNSEEPADSGEVTTSGISGDSLVATETGTSTASVGITNSVAPGQLEVKLELDSIDSINSESTKTGRVAGSKTDATNSTIAGEPNNMAMPSKGGKHNRSRNLWYSLQRERKKFSEVNLKKVKLNASSLGSSNVADKNVSGPSKTAAIISSVGKPNKGKKNLHVRFSNPLESPPILIGPFTNNLAATVKSLEGTNYFNKSKKNLEAFNSTKGVKVRKGNDADKSKMTSRIFTTLNWNETLLSDEQALAQLDNSEKKAFFKDVHLPLTPEQVTRRLHSALKKFFVDMPGTDYRRPDLDIQSRIETAEGIVWICPVCIPRSETNDEPMISCDKCEDWYHFKCIKINEEAEYPANLKWYCKRCIYVDIRDGSFDPDNYQLKDGDSDGE